MNKNNKSDKENSSNRGDNKQYSKEDKVFRWEYAFESLTEKDSYFKFIRFQ